MNILFIGDIFGKAGIRAVTENLDHLKQAYHLDLIIANGENVTGGTGISPQDYATLIKAGVDVVTLGNHAFGQASILQIINNDNLIRPLNLAPDYPYAHEGFGSRLFQVKSKIIRVTNLLGESIGNKKMQTNPFTEMYQLLANRKVQENLHIIDFHAEYSGEKYAFLSEFGGRVAAIIGTHTHVQTADARIYHGTAYITDVGMTGPHDSVIGADPKGIIPKVTGNQSKLVIEEAEGHYQFNAVLMNFDDFTNKATAIKNIYLIEHDKCHCNWD